MGPSVPNNNIIRNVIHKAGELRVAAKWSWGDLWISPTKAMVPSGDAEITVISVSHRRVMFLVCLTIPRKQQLAPAAVCYINLQHPLDWTYICGPPL